MKPRDESKRFDAPMRFEDGTWTDDAAIREKAYQIWVSEGYPEGRHSAHWEQARAEIEGRAPSATDAAASEDSSTPQVAAPKKSSSSGLARSKRSAPSAKAP